MANMLHGSARTTPRIRAERQRSKDKTSTLAQRYGLSRTTVTKWRSRTTTSDAPMAPGQPKSTLLSPAQEAVIVGFRKKPLLPLEDVMGCLRESIPKLSRSSLHRCFQRHGISRLPANEIKTAGRGKFAPTEMGHVHIDIAELRLAQGKLNRFLAIDRVSKLTYAEFRDDMGKMNGADFVRGAIQALPYQIHTVLTDNGMAFADLPKNRDKPIHAFLGMHIFGRVCKENGITHKLTKPYHPWTNGQAETMNRTIKQATIKALHYPDLQSLQAHALAFVCAFNFAKHLKALRCKTPYQTIVDAWQKNPAMFKTDPRHLISGPYT